MQLRIDRKRRKKYRSGSKISSVSLENPVRVWRGSRRHRRGNRNGGEWERYRRGSDRKEKGRKFVSANERKICIGRGVAG